MTVILRVEPFDDKYGHLVELEDIEVIVTGSTGKDVNNLQWCFVLNGSGFVYNGFEPEEYIKDLYRRKPEAFKVKKEDWKFLPISARSFVICIDCGHVIHNKMKGGHRCK